MNLNVGRKFDQPLEDAYELEFDWRLAAATADYLSVQLTADEGPLSTRNYRIQVEAIPVDAKRSLIHMSYAYAYGFAARMAMQTYLTTLGRHKVGFSITGRNAEGKPIYIGGVLGLLERNTMRYYLAIDAYLVAYSLPPPEQFEKRIHEWYGSTQRYAPQLHEMEQNAVPGDEAQGDAAPAAKLSAAPRRPSSAQRNAGLRLQLLARHAVGER